MERSPQRRKEGLFRNYAPRGIEVELPNLFSNLIMEIKDQHPSLFNLHVDNTF
jgi:hypothetical protein